LKKIIFIIFIWIIGGCANNRGIKILKSQYTTNIDAIFGNYYALLIYVDDYTYLPKLRTPKYDIEIISNILKKRYGFKDIEIISNPKNYDELVSILDRYNLKIGDRDNLLIYYAGHGSYENKMQEGFWQLKDARQNSRVGWISVKSAINNTLKLSRAKHILVISDSCYSGAILRDAGTSIQVNRDDLEYYRQIYIKKSRTALTSGGLEPVLDSDPQNPNNSIFTNALFYVLNNNRRAIFTLEEKFPNIKRYVKLKSDQTPQYSDISKTGHEMGGDFIFIDRFQSIQSPISTPTSNSMDSSSLLMEKANRYRRGGDIKRAKDYYIRACNLKGDREACAWLGYIYGKEHDYKSSIIFLKKACKYGHRKSCEILEK